VSLIIHAPNVHQGGGKTLLLVLLEAAKKRPASVALLDKRLEVPEQLCRELSITRVEPTISGRLAGEWALRRVAGDTDLVLCFGNFPPLFKVRGQVVVFLQNRYLVDRCSLDDYSFRRKARLTVERLWLRTCCAHARSFVVQTRTMQQLVTAALGQPVEVMAIFPASPGCQRRQLQVDHDRSGSYDFLYVASGEPHKNHGNLLDAWKLLAADGLYPSLCLTVGGSENPDLLLRIEQAKRDHKLKVSNVTAASPLEMRRLYGQAQALIYPSLMESFGLPLIEARDAGLPVLASELDYVRDVVDPNEVFDPRSPRSIARAVKRFLHVPENPAVILTGDEFVNRLFTM
jgi:glycosyltransferase involved in cell wall biosynthesis